MRVRLPAVPDGRAREVLPAVLVLVLLVVGGLVVRHVHHRSALQEALGMVPESSVRVDFTDWAAVRGRVVPGDEDGATAVPARRVGAMVDRAYDLDLSAASSIDDSAAALAKDYGFSPGNATWEAYAQSRQGAAMVLRMPDDVDLDTVADDLRSLGYDEPGSPDGVWRGGADLVASTDPTLSPEVQYVVLDRDRHLVISSDTPSYAATALRTAEGRARSLSDSDAGRRVEELAGRAGPAAAAFVWTGDFACEDLSMSQAAPEDEAAAAQEVDRVGGVSPLSGLVVAQGADRTVRVAMGFESGDQAKENLRPRADLVVAQDPSRPAGISDYLRLTRSRTQGDAVLLTLTARDSSGAAISQVSSGPVLFETC